MFLRLGGKTKANPPDECNGESNDRTVPDKGARRHIKIYTMA